MLFQVRVDQILKRKKIHQLPEINSISSDLFYKACANVGVIY
jgi:hypothetical protein